MPCRSVLALWVVLSFTCHLQYPLFLQEFPLPQADRRASEVRDLDTPCSFEPPKTKEEWLAQGQVSSPTDSDERGTLAARPRRRRLIPNFWEDGAKGLFD